VTEQGRVALATQVAWGFINTPYRWGGDDPSGMDCSGLCIEVLRSVGKLPLKGDWTAQGLWVLFAAKQTLIAREGCLAFWSRGSDSKVYHVEYCINEETTIGASGGGSTVQSVQQAWDANAFVKVRPLDSRGNTLRLSNPFEL
jgi:cell wall-associated NlpC family hydrolase